MRNVCVYIHVTLYCWVHNELESVEAILSIIVFIFYPNPHNRTTKKATMSKVYRFNIHFLKNNRKTLSLMQVILSVIMLSYLL